MPQVTINDLYEMLNSKAPSLQMFAQSIRQSNEFEVIVKRQEDKLPKINGRLSAELRMKGRTNNFATSPAINDGNGFNNDLHYDGGCDYDLIPGTDIAPDAIEISTSPYDSYSFKELREEARTRIKHLDTALGGLYHGIYSSSHIHTSTAYVRKSNSSDSNGYDSVLKGMPTADILVNIALMMIKFMPAMKWLSMTCPEGARGAHENSYDKLADDSLFYWYRNRREEAFPSYLTGMGRESYMRTYVRPGRRTGDWNNLIEAEEGSSYPLHWENRMLDCCASPTQLSAVMMVTRAISLAAYDMAVNGVKFGTSQQDYEKSKSIMQDFSNSYAVVKSARRKVVESNYNELMSVLSKYLKILDSSDLKVVTDRLIEFPVPEWIRANGLDTGYHLLQAEDIFLPAAPVKSGIRNGEDYLKAIKSFSIEQGKNFAEFNKNVASKLNITEKEASKVYMDLKRHNVPLEFNSGRVVFMG